MIYGLFASVSGMLPQVRKHEIIVSFFAEVKANVDFQSTGNSLAPAIPIPVMSDCSDMRQVQVSGLCRLTSQGMVLQDGRIGDLVKEKINHQEKM